MMEKNLIRDKVWKYESIGYPSKQDKLSLFYHKTKYIGIVDKLCESDFHSIRF